MRKNEYILFEDSILVCCESNIEKPFKFFEYLLSLNKEIFETSINEVLTFKYIYTKKEVTIFDDNLEVVRTEIRLIKNNTFPNTHFDYKNNIFINEYAINGEIKSDEYDLKKQYFTPLLIQEMNKSKELLLKGTKNSKDFIHFVNTNKIILQDIIDNNQEVITTEKSFIDILCKISHFLEKIKETFKLHLPKYEEFQKTKEVDFISSVISYMKGKNEKGEIILNEKDYNLLYLYVQELIEKEKVPNIKKQLKPKISNDLLRFTFWVLHYEKYTTKKIRLYFYDFIKEAFENFKGSEISSIKSQFGTKTRVTKDNFLPEIIIKHL